MAQSDIEHPGWRLTLWPRKSARPSEGPAFALAPYHPLNRSWFKKVSGFSALMLFCLIYGFFFSVFVPSYFVFLLSPLAVLGFLIIWALPDVNWAPTRALEWLLYAVLISLIGWPDYLAIALPGLPWITLLRLTSFPLVVVLLVCISMSADFRAKLKQSLLSVSAIPTLLVIFVAIQFVSIGFSKELGDSTQKFIVAQTTWTATFFAGAYIFLQPGQIRRWAKVLWSLAVFVSLIAIWEYRIGHLPWSGHIPSFLKIEDESVQRILAGSMRAGTDRYRAQATFGTPLGLAEYIALTLPFVLHFTTKRFSRKIRCAAGCSVPLLLYAAYLTDAKLGTIGCLFGVLFYIFAAALHNWRRNKHSLIAASVLFSYPAALCVIASAVLFVQRLRVLILGGSSHGASTDARVSQYTAGMQKFLEWPFGYGIGRSGAVLGFGSDRGMTSIDTYYLTIVLEYGIAGFIVYYGMFAIAIYEGMKRSLFSPSTNEDRSFLLPITISLTTFVIVKSVFSQQDNHPVVFMMLGAMMALIASHRKVPATKEKRAAARVRRRHALVMQ